MSPLAALVTVPALLGLIRPFRLPTLAIATPLAAFSTTDLCSSFGLMLFHQRWPPRLVVLLHSGTNTLLPLPLSSTLLQVLFCPLLRYRSPCTDAHLLLL